MLYKNLFISCLIGLIIQVFQANRYKCALMKNGRISNWSADAFIGFEIDAIFVPWALRTSKNDPIPFAAAFASMYFSFRLYIKIP